MRIILAGFLLCAGLAYARHPPSPKSMVAKAPAAPAQLAATPCNTIVVNQPNCPPYTVGVPYSCQMTANGCFAPYVWSIKSGQLPAGLSLDPNTGLISGTPLALVLPMDERLIQARK